MTRRERDVVASGEAVIAFREDMSVVSWNEAAEKLTGISADEAVGQPCWSLLRGRSTEGAILCHRECSTARHARSGYGVPRHEMTMRTQDGDRRVFVSTLAVRSGDEPLFVHLLQSRETDAEPETSAEDAGPTLTKRQRQVLHLLAEGVSAREIASRLGIAEPTARNHIRGVLIELGAHSQLEAVARARISGIV
jgi:PAS domain S-box-containing protein